MESIITIIVYISIFLILVWYLYTLEKKTILEHLQVSGEAVQNVGSIYNSEKMIVKDLEATGSVKAGTLGVTGDVIKFGKGWEVHSSDGHLRFIKDGDQKVVFHNNDAFWTKENGYLKEAISGIRNDINALRNDKISYNQNVEIFGHSGRLDNYGNRCNSGDRDRDIGINCGNGIGQDWNRWQLRKA
jgi:hypothetical protein